MIQPLRHVPQAQHLTPSIYPVQPLRYKASLGPWDLTLPPLFHPPPSPSRHLNNLFPSPPCLVQPRNGVTQRKHHHPCLPLLTTRSPQPYWSLKDATSQSPQSIRDYHARAGYRWVDVEGATPQPARSTSEVPGQTGEYTPESTSSRLSNVEPIVFRD